MRSLVKLFSNKNNEIYNFLNKMFDKSYNKKINEYTPSMLEWENKYENPIELADIIGVFIENKDNFKINMWISLDENVLINVTDYNADKIIRYLYERYPY